MKKLIVCGLTLTMLLTGCGGAPAETTEPATTAAVPQTSAAATESTGIPATVPAETAPVDLNPLTGEALDTVSNTRPVAVMLNNHSAALPQCGIGEADMIFEILAEGSTTRLMALFSDITNAGPVGPVRSLRAYYLNIMRGYNAICTSAGGSDEADRMVWELGYDRVNGIGGAGVNYFYRDPWRRDNRGYEHSMFIEGQNILKGAAEAGMVTELEAQPDYGMTFEEAPMTSGEDVGVLTVHFRDGGKTTELTYSPEKNGYIAFQQGKTLIDGNTKEGVIFRNVLVLWADTSVMDGEGHLDVQTTGEGEGYFARDGKLQEITWKRADNESNYEFYDASGNPITFGIGKTYAAIVPTGSPVDLAG